MPLAVSVLGLQPPIVMGVLNVTPDSFFDGDRYLQPGKALSRALAMEEEGAGIIDIGGESTRPNAAPVSVEEELQRVIPVIQAIREQSDIPLSIDSSKPVVMHAAVAAGANLINDVCALQQPDALQTAAKLQVPVCLMHMQGQPDTMQQQPRYENVLEEVMAFLRQRSQACLDAGIPTERIIVDPGFGFGKSLPHNLTLFKQLGQFQQLGFPLLVGVSRKSMISALLDIPPEARLAASVALAGLAVWLGASIIRAHDVQATVQAVKMCQAVKNA